MELRLVNTQQTSYDERYWLPFAASDGFTPHWWNNPVRTPNGNRSYLSAIEGETEVARVELDEGVYFDYYRNVPTLAATPLEIQLIEVHAAHRTRGVGQAVVDLLASRHSDRILVACSEEADGFWESLGWTRYIHEDDDEIAPRHRPLYIQTQKPLRESGSRESR